MFRQSPCPKILIKKSTESPSMTKQCFLIWPFCCTCRGNFRPKFCLGFGCCPHCFILLKNLFSQKFCKCAVNIGVAQIRGSSRSSLWQLAIAKCFADANSLFIVIALAKILPRWLFGSKIIVYKQEISLAHAREVSVCATRSQVNYIFSAVYSSSFYSFTWQWNKLCFRILYHRIGGIL